MAEGDISLFSQRDVDDFQNCNFSIIDGTVTISGSDITDLSTFKGITEITGNLIIVNNDNLEYLEGWFNSLERIGGDLNIILNNSLKNVNGFPSLISANRIDVILNRDLLNVSGFSKLKDGVKGISIKENAQLTQFQGFRSLENVNVDIAISDNSSLEVINAFEALSVVGRNLSIQNNAVLKDVDGFSNVNRIKGGIQIIGNAQLENLSEFSNLETLERDLYIVDNPKLEEIKGFPKLTSLRSFNIERNESLLTIKGFDKLQATSDDFTIRDNAQLKEISGFAELASVIGKVEISNHNELVAINGFSALTDIYGDLFLLNNNQLSELTAFSNLVYVEESLKISNNPQLEICCALFPLLAQDGVRRGTMIAQNAEGCNDIDEVFNSCGAIASIKIQKVNGIHESNFFQIKEKGIIHYYFKVLDEYNSPIENIKLNYAIKQNGVTRIEEAVNMGDGLFDLKIKQRKENPIPQRAELIELGLQAGVADVFFHNTVPERNILKNTFEPIIINVVPLTPDEIINGFYANAGLNIEACAGCAKVGPFGIAALSFGAGVGVGKSLEFKNVINDAEILSGYDFKFTHGVKLKAEGKLGDVSLFVPEIKGELASIEISVEPKQFKRIFIDKNSDNDFLKILSLLAVLKMETDVANQSLYLPLRNAILNYLDKNVDGFNFTEEGEGVEIEGDFSVGFDLEFDIGTFKSKLGFFNTDFKGVYELSKVTEFHTSDIIARENLIFKKFGQLDFTPFRLESINYDNLGIKNLVNSSSVSVGKGLVLTNTNGPNGTFIEGGITFNNTTSEEIQNKKMNVEYSSTTKLGKDAIRLG